MMWRWLTEQRRKVVGVVVFAIPLVMIVSLGTADIGTNSTQATGWGGGAVGAVQAGLSSAAGSVGGWWHRLTGRQAVVDENEQLTREVDRLREEKTRLIGVLQENTRLREMVGFQTDYPEFDLAAAQVIARDVTPYYRVVKIRIRSRADLEPRMPVVAPDGVVGQVHRVYGRTADVVLVTDPRSRIDAISQRNRTLGIVEGLGHRDSYRTRLAYVTEHDEVELGDEMVTSGMGGVFPRELTIGTIVQIERVERELFQEVTVEPAVDFSRLEEVFVITNHEQPG